MVNYIDVIIAVILAYTLIRGFSKGLIIEFASVIALIAGIWGALHFSGYVGKRLTDYFDLTTQYLGLIAFFITFIGIVLGVHFIAVLIDKLLKAVALGLVVRILGAFFGLIKGALILSIILVILNTWDQSKDFLPKEQLGESVLYYPISSFAPSLFPIIEGGDLLDSFKRFETVPPVITM